MKHDIVKLCVVGRDESFIYTGTLEETEKYIKINGMVAGKFINKVYKFPKNKQAFESQIRWRRMHYYVKEEDLKICENWAEKMKKVVCSAL